MDKFKLLFLLILACFTIVTCAENIYADPLKTLNQRVNKLVFELSLDEKVHHMIYKCPAVSRLNIRAYE